MFNEELNLVKKEFNTKTPNLTPTQPKFAGAAAWARALKRRIDRPMDVINKAFYLPKIGAGEEIRNQYLQLSQALEEFVGKTFQEWALSIDKVNNSLRSEFKISVNPLNISDLIQHKYFSVFPSHSTHI